MEPTEKELEDRLKDLGARLTSPPSGVDDLLLLLDQTEIYLSRVEQSPSKSMSDALSPIINSLITKELLNHPETNVKVFVAACINEITRITAPDAPYSDSLMKDIFAVIVDVFGKLDDISGPSYSKKVSILETVAKVRSCVVMLDLECDDLILQMFKHFLKSIRPEHSINVFSSMETIMSLVLEDSEGISEELLFCLLSNAHKSKKDVMPVACRLAESVISNSAMKLKPYLLAAAKLTGFCLSDYVDIVASICQECSVAPEQNEVQESKLPERTVDNGLPQESKKPDKSESCFQDFGAFADKAKKVLSNGLVPRGNHNPIVEPVSSEFKHENSSYNEPYRNNTALKTEDVNFGSNNEKPCNELDSKHVEAKSFSVQLPYASDSSRVEDDKEASSPITRRIGRKRKGKSLRSDMAPEIEVLLEPEREVELRPLEGLVGDDGASVASKTAGVVEPEREVEFSPIEGQVGDSTCVVSAAACKDLPGNRLSKGGKSTKSQFSAKGNTAHKTAWSSGKKEILENTPMEQEGSPAIVSARKEDHCAVSNFDMKPSLDSAKKSLEDNATADVSTTVVSGGGSLKEEQKEHVKNLIEGISFGKNRKYSIKPPKFKDAAKEDISAEPCLKMKVGNENGTKGKERSYIHWTSQMDNVLSTALLEQQVLGNKAANGWKSVAFNAAIEAMQVECKVIINKEKIMTRLKTWNKYYQEISAMLDTSGFSWDWERNVVRVDSEDVWANYIAAHPTVKHYRSKVIVNWGDLGMLCGFDRATGAQAATATETMNDVNIDVPVDEPVVEQVEARPKRKKKKKVATDIIADAITVIARSMEKDNIVPVQLPQLSRADKIYAALAEISDLTEDEIISAIDMLNVDEAKTDVFLALPVSIRRTWLRRHLQEMIVSSKASREADNDGNHLGKLADTSSTKKSRRKTSGWKIHTGRKIEVWWPDDQMFYKGVIKSFDPVTKKHMVVYDDGDIEHLLLGNERWSYVDSENLEKGHEDNNVVLESSLQVPKKARDGGSGKFKATPERSDAKSKGTPIQQSDEKKPTVKSSAGSKGKTSKVATSANEKIEGTCGDDGTKVDVSPQANNSNEPPEDKTSSMVKSDEKSDGLNVLPSASAGKTVKRSKRRLPKGKKNPQTVTEKSETKDDTSGDAGVVEDDTLTPVKLEGKSDGEERFGGRVRRKSALKSADKPISGRSSIGTQTDIVAFEEYSTPSITQEKRVGDVLKLTSGSVNTRKKETPTASTNEMKETPTASVDGIIDVKNYASGGTKVDDSVLPSGAAVSQRSVVKPNKRRRRK